MSGISVRFSLRFGVAIFALVILGLSIEHWIELRKAKQSLQQIHAIASTKAIALEKTYAYMMRERLGAAVYSFAVDQNKPDQKKRMLDVLPGHLQNIEKQLAMFESIPLPDTQGDALAQSLVAAFRGYVNDYVKPTYQAVLHDDMNEMKRLQLASTDGALSLNKALSDFNEYAGTVTATSLQRADEDFARATFLSLAGLFVVGILAVLALWGTERGVIGPLALAIDQFERLAHGNLSIPARVAGAKELQRLLSATETTRESLRSIVTGVRQSTGEMNVGVDEITAGSSDLSSRTEEQAASLEETASSMEQIAANVQQSATHARTASELAVRASRDALAGGDSVRELIETMHGITESAQRVDEIIAVIEGIAFQTNILALNAAVEAARAGEQGRGFAVVAGEVRNLAQRSASAAQEVKALIIEATQRANAGETKVNQVENAISEIVVSVKRVTSIVEEIAAAAAEQSIGIGQINQSVNEMDNVTQQNAALVEQSFAATASLQTQAKHLEKVVSVFII